MILADGVASHQWTRWVQLIFDHPQLSSGALQNGFPQWLRPEPAASSRHSEPRLCSQGAANTAKSKHGQEVYNLTAASLECRRVRINAASFPCDYANLDAQPAPVAAFCCISIKPRVRPPYEDLETKIAWPPAASTALRRS